MYLLCVEMHVYIEKIFILLTIQRVKERKKKEKKGGNGEKKGVKMWT